MRAVQVHEPAGPDAVRVVDIEVPDPGDDALLVDVTVSGVSFPDLLLTSGRYQLKPPMPFTLGVEGAGRVSRAPAGGRFAEGERVAFVGLGSLAEQCVVDPASAFAVPESMSDEQAAALVMNYQTAHFALVRRGGVRSGETVLVHGAAGGTGTAACQVAKALGARVIAVVSSDTKESVAREAGADVVVRSGEGWLAAVQEATDGRGVDCVFDPVGGERFLDTVRSLSPEGRLMVVGFAEGTIPTVTANRLLLRNVDVRGVGWGAFIGAHPGVADDIHADLLRMAEEGFVRPMVGPSYPLEETAAALHELAARTATAKVVVRVTG